MTEQSCIIGASLATLTSIWMEGVYYDVDGALVREERGPAGNFCGYARWTGAAWVPLSVRVLQSGTRISPERAALAFHEEARLCRDCGRADGHARGCWFGDGVRIFECFFTFIGWHCWSLGIHIDPTGPYVDLHVLSGFARIGWFWSKQPINRTRQFGWTAHD